MSTAPTTAPARQQYGRLISTEQLKLLFIMLFGLSGASALIYEIAWVRLLSLAFGVSVYAVSIVVSTFMGGLALGSWLFGRLLRELRTKTQEPILEQSNKATKQQSTSIHIENITLSTDHQVTLPSNGQPPATSHQPRRLLRLYAALQFGVALFALLSPLLFRQISGLYAQIDQAGALSPIATAALRFGLAALILLVPTVLMGGTLPLAAQLLAQRTSERGSVLGALYASNTLGAVCGTAMAGVVLIRLFGTQATILIAAAGDLLVAGVAIWLSSQSIEQLQKQRAQVSGRRKPKREKRKTQDPRPKTQDPGPNDLQRSATVRNTDDGRRATNIQSPIAHRHQPHPYAAAVVLAGFALSGFASLGYQVIWTRMLAIFSLNAIFSFSIMLAIFLSGLAIGGALMAPRVDRAQRPIQYFGLLQLAIGISGVLALHIFARLYTLKDAFTSAETLGGAIWAEVFAAAITMLLPTLLIGATFPVAVRIYGDPRADVGTHVGQLYALNTIGAMLGSLTAGFVLIPALGLQRATLALIVLNLSIGIAALLASGITTRRVKIGLAVTLAAIGAGVALLPPGVYLGFRDGVIPALKYYHDGIDATVAVFETTDPPLKISFVNGRNEVPTDAQSMRAFYMLGHLPALLRPEARDALVVSFGNGIATGSLAQHPLERITAVELVEGQVDAARQLYQAENRHVLDDPRLTIAHEDGRNYLLRTTDEYDIITADATHPINSSSWALFTSEFYTLVRGHLKDDGVFIQWLPFHDLAAEDYQDIVRTFQSVFPNTTLFYTGGIHTFLVATPKPLTRADIAALEAAMQSSAAGHDLGSAAKLADDLLLDTQGVADYARGARIVTDDTAFFLPQKNESKVLQSFAPYALSQK